MQLLLRPYDHRNGGRDKAGNHPFPSSLNRLRHDVKCRHCFSQLQLCSRSRPCSGESQIPSGETSGVLNWIRILFCMNRWIDRLTIPAIAAPMFLVSEEVCLSHGLTGAWTVAFITSFTSMILALFGSGGPRILLLVSSLLCLVLAYGSMLQNGI